MKEVYLVVTDLHLSGHSKVNRHNYDKELFCVFHKIVDLINKYEEEGRAVFLVLLGDIFDKSYKSPEKYGVDSSFFVKLRRMTRGLYVCVGNHELNFYLNNPFWTLVSDIQSKRINAIQRVNTQPLGFENTFFVADYISVGNCVMHFNHYGCEDSPPHANKTNIAFCHKPYYSDVLLKDAAINSIPADYARAVKNFPVESLMKYDYAFLGHMHWFYGTWKMGDLIIRGLASLGRPSKAEVVDSFLERNIPAVLLSDGELERIEDNYLMLPPREESVIAEVDTAQSENYAIKKKRKEAQAYVSTTDDPIENIRVFLSEQPSMLGLFDSLLDKTWSRTDVVNQILQIERRSRD